MIAQAAAHLGAVVVSGGVRLPSGQFVSISDYDVRIAGGTVAAAMLLIRQRAGT